MTKHSTSYFTAMQCDTSNNPSHARYQLLASNNYQSICTFDDYENCQTIKTRSTFYDRINWIFWQFWSTFLRGHLKTYHTIFARNLYYKVVLWVYFSFVLTGSYEEQYQTYSFQYTVMRADFRVQLIKYIYKYYVYTFYTDHRPCWLSQGRYITSS